MLETSKVGELTKSLVWYLPSAKEIVTMIIGNVEGNIWGEGQSTGVANMKDLNEKLKQVSGAETIGGFMGINTYWSSTEAKDSEAFGMNCIQGSAVTAGKSSGQTLRCIFAF